MPRRPRRWPVAAALLLTLATATPPAATPTRAASPTPSESPHGEIFRKPPVRTPLGPDSNPSALAGAVVPAGFRDELVIGGLTEPTVVQFAADGRIVVGEKSGRIKIYSSPTDGSPGVYTGLMSKVFNLWDRGFLGMVIDPNFTTGRPYIYVSYTYNHILGDSDPAPKWPVGDCPDPPGFNDDGCIVSGRIDRLTVSGKNVTGGPTILVEDWCQQFPSHSMGALAFGPEGALYATGGEGASFNEDDWGQLGGTHPDADGNFPTPANPCGDPNTAKGTATIKPGAEGGSLRSQDLRGAGTDPVGLSGTLIRVDPDTGLAWPTNANYGASTANERRILAYGLRNPFRFTIRPGTSEVWIGDVGNYSWEEIDQLPLANGARKNFGWPCYEGNSKNSDWDGENVTICENLYAAPTSVTAPAFTYPHSKAIAGETCDLTRGSAIAGITFLGTGSSYPNQYDKALFFTDYNRRCIWWVPADPTTGRPDFGLPPPNSNARLFANLARSDPADTDGGAVFLGTDRNGDLVYSDFDRGEIRRIRWYSSVPPTASFTATPTSGAMPLQVTFDASGSTNPNPLDDLQYAWDLDGDGAFDDGTTNPIVKTYTGSTKKTVVVGLKVTSSTPLSDTTTRTIYPGYVAPTVTMSQPPASLTWNPNDVIPFSATAMDGNGAQLPASAYSWAMNIEHCPSACHSHPAFFVAPGVKAGTFPAPNHEYPSRIRVKLTVTDGPVSTIVIREIAMAAPIDDGSNTCAGSPAPTVPSGLWTAGRFASSNDVDWYRFTLSMTTRVRIVLGDLAVPGKLELYRGCTTLLSRIDRPGTTVEELFANLSAGTYAIKLSGSGTPSTPAYTRLIRAMPASVHVMSARSKVSGSSLTLVGEVYNNTAATRGPVTVTAKLYNSTGNVLATWTSETLPALLPATRTPFRIAGAVPAGYHHASYTVTAGATSGLVVRPVTTGVTAGPDSATKWKISGTVQNGATTIRWLRVDLAAYDNHGEIVDTVRAAVGATTLGANASTTFTGTFPTAGYVPIRWAVWTYALR